MRPTMVFRLLWVCVAQAAAAAVTQPPTLLTPPADATQFTIMSPVGRHGQSAWWVTADGTRLARESLNLRGQVFETDSTVAKSADGMIAHLKVRGSTPTGDAAETFDIDGGTAHWQSPVDKGAAPYAKPAIYCAFGGPIDLTAELVEALVAAPGRSLPMLPGGEAHVEVLTQISVGEGTAKRALTAYAVTGISATPQPVWLDEQGRFFAIDTGITYIRSGYEAFQPALLRAQDDALAARSAAIARQLVKNPTGPVAFTHIRAFVDGTRFVEDETVVVDTGIIKSVGPATKIVVPKGAETIDGSGKTLVPGLWDSHQHVADDASGPMLLSLGITSVRDPGNINPLTLARARRREAGALLMPKVYPSSLIDGKGPLAAQVGTAVGSKDEALAAVRQAKADGFVAVKLYGSFNPDWVAATAAEAHRLGLHVHGHVPAGMRPLTAIDDGYDEITHIYFVIMQAMPDAVVARSNTLERMAGPARYAKDVDLQAGPMASLIATMAKRKITSDPTLVVVESLMVPDSGELSASYAPFLGTLPPAVERGFRQGGLAVPADLSRADFRASFAKLVQLVGVMHSNGVPIVAGTDGLGLELVHELELYVRAGFSPSEALASATLAPAHLLNVDDRTGSIAVGKAADLVVVEGNPAANIGALRQTRLVMMGGKMIDADALRTAGGIAGRPKPAG